MTTPTPGDNEVNVNDVNMTSVTSNLSARHVEALNELRIGVEFDAHCDPLGVQKLEALDAAIAALSALPAAGVEVEPAAWRHRYASGNVGRWKLMPVNSPHVDTADSTVWIEYAYPPTTPQPSAAEGLRVNIRCEVQDNGVVGTQYLNVLRVESEDDGSFTAVTDHWPPDAAVGAQGELVSGAVWLDGGVALVRVGSEDEWCRERGAQRMYLTAPTAGRGVDELPAKWRQIADSGSTVITDYSAGARWAYAIAAAELEAALTRQPVAGDGWREASNELECCDDVPLQDGLAAGIRCLREQRDHARASMDDVRNKLRDRAAELRASGMKFGLRSLHEAADLLIELRKGLPNTEPAPAATPTDGGEGA